MEFSLLRFPLKAPPPSFLPPLRRFSHPLPLFSFPRSSYLYLTVHSASASYQSPSPPVLLPSVLLVLFSLLRHRILFAGRPPVMGVAGAEGRAGGGGRA